MSVKDLPPPLTFRLKTESEFSFNLDLATPLSFLCLHVNKDCLQKYENGYIGNNICITVAGYENFYNIHKS